MLGFSLGDSSSINTTVVLVFIVNVITTATLSQAQHPLPLFFFLLSLLGPG